MTALISGEEYQEEDDEDIDMGYDEMDVEDLKYLCEERGVEYPAKCTKSKLVQLLEEDDDAFNGKSDEEYEDEEDEDEDDLMNSVKNAVKNKRNRK